MNTPAVICRGNYEEIPARMAAAIGGELIVARASALIPALQSAFVAGRPIVTNVAAAIVIRALAPFLDNKHTDPPVVATSLDGRFVVPLLGISHGAARLASKIAEALGTEYVRFGATATHFSSGTALDDAPEGYFLHNHEDYKDFAVSMLDGEKVCIEGDAPWFSSLPQSADAKLRIMITDRNISGSPQHLVFQSYTLAVGVGCERGTTPEEVTQLIGETFRQHNLSLESVACFASIDIKEDEPAINDLALKSKVRFFTADELNLEARRIRNPSDAVQRETGTPSVAEASALAAAGPDAELLVPKKKSTRATCAVARAPRPILDYRGRQRGLLSVVGIGPGEQSMRSSAAELELWAATDWVGYGLYLNLIQDKRDQQIEHRFPLGSEEERVRHAIDLAKEGKQVALICSGDAGIYAMAALVYETIDLEPCRIEVNVIPGISAFQAAAAKVGAMIGHDFCCISLSDLLTPWDVIEQRIKAAAVGDFVIAFYNPRSLKRRDQLERAFTILAQHRPANTPVVIASNLGRPEEKVRIVAFSDFNPDDVDMLTLVMVGSSQSKSFARGDGRTYAYTPRGYARKREQP